MPSYPFDPELHTPGSAAAQGRCSWHGADGDTESGDDHGGRQACAGEAVVSFEDTTGHWQSGCSRALAELVEKGDIEPLGQGA